MMTTPSSIYIYNSQERCKQLFKPIQDGKVRMYVCGPTVYDYIHIGNARPLIVFDVAQKYLRSIGYDVKYVVNFTDVDDKLIRKAEQLGGEWTVPKVAERYITAFYEDIAKLGVAPADVRPRVTEHMTNIVNFVGGLIEKEFAYVKEGDVYFRTDRFVGYGKLSNQDLESLQHGSRIDVNERKENATDFVLWKAAKPGEIFWNTPWGDGRPGWHIECSAMAKEHLGETIDIHGGGHDLMFPHHECEVAQSEALHDGKPLANYWMHNGYIQINQEKMSKSLGNGVFVRDLMQNITTAAFRYFMLGSHYRSPLNFSDDAIVQAKSSVERIANSRINAQHRLQHVASLGNDQAEAALSESIEQISNEYHALMCDDFNTPDALTCVFRLVSAANLYLEQVDVLEASLKKINDLFDAFNEVLGVCPAPEVASSADPEVARIELLLEERQEARRTKNWARADEIRKELAELNIMIEDTAQGARWVRK